MGSRFSEVKDGTPTVVEPSSEWIWRKSTNLLLVAPETDAELGAKQGSICEPSSMAFSHYSTKSNGRNDEGGVRKPYA